MLPKEGGDSNPIHVEPVQEVLDPGIDSVPVPVVNLPFRVTAPLLHGPLQFQDAFRHGLHHCPVTIPYSIQAISQSERKEGVNESEVILEAEMLSGKR